MDENQGIGYTIFQGNSSFQIDADTDAQRQLLEEQEAKQAQKKREEELGHELHSAFDDLADDGSDEDIDDDDDDDGAGKSIEYNHNSYTPFTGGNVNNTEKPKMFNKQHQQYTNPIKQQQYQQKIQLQNHQQQNLDEHQPKYNDLLDEILHLNKVIESKTRECNHISGLYESDKKQQQKQLDELKKRLAIAEAEKEQALMTRQQTHELLVESKEKCSEMDDVIGKLKNKIQLLEERNTELVTELEHTRTNLSDVQHKYQMFQKDTGANNGRQTDAIIKQATEHYHAKIDVMQQQIDGLRNKLDNEQLQVKTLSVRYNELQKSREKLLLEKSQIINELAKNLEGSQRQCQLLMSNGESANENICIKQNNAALQRQTQDMQKTIDGLMTRLESKKSDEYLETVLNHNNDTTPSSFNYLKNSKIIGSTPIETMEHVKRLKNELHEKTKEIKQLRLDENKTLIELNKYREEANRLSSKVSVLDGELKKLQKIINKHSDLNTVNDIDNSSIDFDQRHIQLLNTNKQLIDELKKLKDNYNEIELNNKKLINEIDKQDKEISENNEKLKTITIENENLRKQLSNSLHNANQLDDINNIKLELEKTKFLLEDSQNECNRLKNLYINLSGTKDELTRELATEKAKDLNMELSVQMEKIATLQHALQLANLKSSELMKILDKNKIEYEMRLNELHDRYENDKIDNIKDYKNSSNGCTKCIEQMTALAKLEILNLQLQTSCTNYIKEINDLKTELTHSRSTIDDLRSKIIMKDEHDKLIIELKEKATQFEEFIKYQNSLSSQNSIETPRTPSIQTSSSTSLPTPTIPLSSSSLSPASVSAPPITTQSNVTSSIPIDASTNKQVKFIDKCVSTSSTDIDDLLESIRLDSRENERKMREHMAQILAREIKLREERYQHQIDLSSEKIEKLNNQLEHLQQNCDIKSEEVETLKFAILAERSKMKTILQENETESKLIFEKQNDLLRKCRDELSAAHKKNEHLQKIIVEHKEQFDAELESVLIILRQSDEEKKKSINNEQFLRNRLHELEIKYEKEIEELNVKYKSAKKTALNYKQYSEDKDKHILQENERIKIAYETAINKIKDKMENSIKEYEKRANEKIAQMKAEYEEKYNKSK